MLIADIILSSFFTFGKRVGYRLRVAFLIDLSPCSPSPSPLVEMNRSLNSLA